MKQSQNGKELIKRKKKNQALTNGDEKNGDWVYGNNEWIEKKGVREKSEERAEREAVNQSRESGQRERGEVSQMEKEKEESWPAAAVEEEEEDENVWWGNGSDE